MIYRPEIDGLRAIAVVSVILYHTQNFKGGFIGVDIFFVISGYLITSFILKELVTTGTFSFYNFYERRIRRILPALLFVMLASLPLAWMYLLPSSFIDVSKSILYALGFSSNFYFHYSGQQYGAESGLLKPFLHTWSLSVEEQFYIFFPIVFYLIFKFSRKYLIHILIFGFVVSLGLADWGSKNFPSSNFYFLPTRGWELLVGSVLAKFEITLGHRSKNKTLNLILPSVGFLLIVHSILFFNDEMYHPSYYTLSPIIGVCLIIWFSIKDELITKILSTKLFVGIGLISYSLYLWHYPILALGREIGLYHGSFSIKFITAVTIVSLSIFSYVFIEKKFRDRKNNFKKTLSYLLFSLIFLLVFNFCVILFNGYEGRFNYKFSGNLKLTEDKSQILIKNLTGQEIYNKNITVNSNKSDLNIFLVGDSHAETLAYGIWKNFKDTYNINFSIFSGCPLILNLNRVNKKTLEPKSCSQNLQKERLEFINKQNNSIVILFGRLPTIVTEENFNNFEYGFIVSEREDFLQDDKNSLKTKLLRQKSIEINFKKTIKALSENNHNIIIVYPMPEVGLSVPKIIKNYILNKNIELSDKGFFTTSYEIYKNRTNSTFELLDSIQGKNIYRVYPHTLFCDAAIKDRCLTHDDINLFYRDDNHPSLKGAEMINDLISKEIEKIELSKKID